MSKFTCKCNQCGGTTSIKYARANGGKCKPCVTGVARKEPTSRGPTRNERMLESGYQNYAREEGYYGGGDY